MDLYYVVTIVIQYTNAHQLLVYPKISDIFSLNKD